MMASPLDSTFSAISIFAAWSYCLAPQFPHYVRWFSPQKPPFIAPFRGDVHPFPSISQLCHETNMTTAMGLPWVWSPFWMDFPMAFSPPSSGGAVTKSRSSSSSRGTKRAACGVLANAASNTGRLRSAGELCLADDGLQDLLWNKDPLIEVIIIYNNNG